jgi:hypothetical protein
VFFISSAWVNPDFLLGGRTSASAECRHWSGRAARWSSCAILKLFGFETYAPRLRDRRIIRGSKVIKTPLLFPGYIFVLVQLQ